MFRNIMTNHFSSFWTKLALSLTSPVLAPHNKMIVSRECKHHLILDTIRTLLISSSIPDRLYFEAHSLLSILSTVSLNPSLITNPYLKLLHGPVWNCSYFLMCLFCFSSHENLSLNLAFVVFIVIVSLKDYCC